MSEITVVTASVLVGGAAVAVAAAITLACGLMIKKKFKSSSVFEKCPYCQEPVAPITKKKTTTKKTEVKTELVEKTEKD